MRPHSTKRDIFVTRSAKFKAMRSRALALLDKNSQPVKLHAMGAAITRCCDLALAVQAYADGQVDLDIQTATVEVYDEFEPLVEVRCLQLFVYVLLFLISHTHFSALRIIRDIQQ